MSLVLPLLLWAGMSLALEDDIQLGSKKLLVIEPLKSSVSLTELEKTMIDKTILKTCSRQSRYQISLGALGIAKDAGMQIYHVTLALRGKSDAIEVSALLLDETQKTVVGKASASNVSKLNLVRSIEDALASLFRKPQSTK